MADAFVLDCIFAAGAIVAKASMFDGLYDEDLVVSPNAVRLARLNAGAPVLNTHRQDDVRRVIGAVVPGSARIESGLGMARLRFSKEPVDSDIVGKIRDDLIKGVSIGYVQHRIEEVDRPHALRPLRRVVDWEPYEISVCPIGADPGAMLLRQITPAALARSRMMASRHSACRPVPSTLASQALARMRMREAAAKGRR